MDCSTSGWNNSIAQIFYSTLSQTRTELQNDSGSVGEIEIRKTITCTYANLACLWAIRKINGSKIWIDCFGFIASQNFRNWFYIDRLFKQSGFEFPWLDFEKNADNTNDLQKNKCNGWEWLKDHIATSIHLDVDDLDYTSFDAEGGKGKMWQLFGEQMDEIINELNEALAA